MQKKKKSQDKKPKQTVLVKEWGSDFRLHVDPQLLKEFI